MTGEMSRADVTPEAFPLHFAVAKTCGGTVEPFDQYQGPYVLTPAHERLFLIDNGDTFACWWNEQTNIESHSFPPNNSEAESLAINAATSIMLTHSEKQIVITLTAAQLQFIRSLLYGAAQTCDGKEQEDFIAALTDQFEQCEVED